MKLVKQIFSSYYLKKSGYLPFYENNLKSIKNKSIQKSFRLAYKGLLNRRNELQKGGFQRIDDIVQKYKMCDDENIKKEAQRHILNIFAIKEDCDLTASALSRAERILDCVNTAAGKYSILSEYYPTNAAAYSLKDSSELYNLTRTEIRKIYDTSRQKEIAINADDMYNSCNLNSIKEYITSSINETPIGEYLWEKYFLSRHQITPELKQKLKMINEKYGVKVFFDKPYENIKSLIDYIIKEFEIWNYAGKEEVKYPKIFDITRYVQNFINRTAQGDANYFISRIRVNNTELQNSIRHEMVHINYNGIIEDKITIPENRKKELRRAGISDELISYAETNDNEYAAVWGEGDMTAYSDDFKQEMINKGIPEFITRLSSHEKFDITRLKEIIKDEKSLEFLEEMRSFCAKIKQ